MGFVLTGQAWQRIIIMQNNRNSSLAQQFLGILIHQQKKHLIGIQFLNALIG